MIENNKDFMDDQLEQTPVEKIAAVEKLKSNIEDEFLQIGQLLSEMKENKVYKYKGFTSFSDFLAEKLNFTLGSKILTIYELFINDLELDAKLIEEIGFDKLNLLKPIIKSVPEDELEKWLEKAKDSHINNLKTDVREWKDQNCRKKEITFKDILISQFNSQMTGFLDCNKSDLDFKLALYFQDRDGEWLQECKDLIRKREQIFFDTHVGSVSEAEKEQMLFSFADSPNPKSQYDLSFQRLLDAGLTLLIDGGKDSKELIYLTQEEPTGRKFNADNTARVDQQIDDEIILIKKLKDQELYGISGTLSFERIKEKGLSVLQVKDLKLYETHKGIDGFEVLNDSFESEGQVKYAVDGFMQNENCIMRSFEIPDISHLLEDQPEAVEDNPLAFTPAPKTEPNEENEPEEKTA